MRALVPELGGHPLAARVQRDAVGELPDGVAAHTRPVCDGAHRLLEGWRPARRVSLVHGLDVDLPVATRAPMVATVHDLSVFDVPWAFSATRAAGERVAVSRGIRRADALVAVSGFTARAIEARFGRSATVTHLAPRSDLMPPTAEDCERVRAGYRLPERFVLHVGNIEPRKDVAGLARACRRLGVELVLAGAVQTEVADGPGVRLLGYVPSEDLAPLYAAASAVGYPSLYEGFGLPPIEAMACGGAVVATAVGALPEVVDTDIPLVAVGDAEALVEALDAAVNDHAHNAHLRRCGQRSAGRLTWAATARATVEVYRGLGLAIGAAPYVTPHVPDLRARPALPTEKAADRPVGTPTPPEDET